MLKSWQETDYIKNFPKGVKSVFHNGKRIRKEEVEIERNCYEILNSELDLKNLPGHIIYLPRKQAAEYLGVSESTLTRYHLKGKLKSITRKNRTPIYERKTLDNFKEKNKGKHLS